MSSDVVGKQRNTQVLVYLPVTYLGLILQAHAVSFCLVRWFGVSSVISQNILTCDWSELTDL